MSSYETSLASNTFLSGQFPNILHFIGIKGSGMAALSLLLHARGIKISGSDIADEFYTDSMLHEAGIPICTDFSIHNIPTNTDAVIYSAAYTPDNNEELAYALEHYPCYSYPQSLGAFSRKIKSSWAVIGTHGKTSTTALVGTLLRSQHSLATVLTGTRVKDFDNSTFFSDGDEIFVAEVCEYREHFMNFRATGIIFLNAEWDHTDYFKDEEAVYNSFATFIETLPYSGTVIACISDRGVQHTLDKVAKNRNDLQIIPYEFNLKQQELNKEKDANIHVYDNKKNTVVLTMNNYTRRTVAQNRVQSFNLFFKNCEEKVNKTDNMQLLEQHTWNMQNPTYPLVGNTMAALLCVQHCVPCIDISLLDRSLLNFSSLSRRAELLYNKNGIYIIDDYAHHPTAIAATLQSFVEHYAPRRCIVDFMSHTYTRTEAFWSEFQVCFKKADILIINDIYSSAREKDEYFAKIKKDINTPVINGEILAQHIGEYQQGVISIPSFEESAEYILSIIQEGDICITMGAGDNFRVATMLIAALDKSN